MLRCGISPESLPYARQPTLVCTAGVSAVHTTASLLRGSQYSEALQVVRSSTGRSRNYVPENAIWITPQSNPEGYKECNLKNLAYNPKGHPPSAIASTKCHDDTCVPQHTNFRSYTQDQTVILQNFFYQRKVHQNQNGYGCT